MKGVAERRIVAKERMERRLKRRIRLSKHANRSPSSKRPGRVIGVPTIQKIHSNNRRVVMTVVAKTSSLANKRIQRRLNKQSDEQCMVEEIRAIMSGKIGSYSVLVKIVRKLNKDDSGLLSKKLFAKLLRVSTAGSKTELSNSVCGSVWRAIVSWNSKRDGSERKLGKRLTIQSLAGWLGLVSVGDGDGDVSGGVIIVK